MKKAIAVILTIITALGFTLGLSGCKREEYPEMTAEKPVYDYYFWKNKTSYQFKIPIGNGSDFYYSSVQNEYEEFLKFYFGGYKTMSDEIHYIVDPVLTIRGYMPPTRGFHVYYDEPEEGSDKLTGVFLSEWVRVYQKGLDKRYDRKKLKTKGESKWTAKIEFIMPAVAENYGDDYMFEYGESDVDIYDYFINVYTKEAYKGAEKVYIATAYCQFRNKKNIPFSWVEQYITTNMYYGG